MLIDKKYFSVNRLKWSRGGGKNTKILDDSGKMDCIGFLLKANGAEDKQLLNLDEPTDIVKQNEWITKLIEWSGSICYQSPICLEIIKANDIIGTPDPWREERLIALFKSIDIKLEFVG